jgi:AcrR family transcriptional regulator
MKPGYVSLNRQAPHGEPTRIHILDCAEWICAENGLEAVSIRAVVERAQVNLGAVTYHFGSKQGLLEAMFKRRVVPMNEKRIVLLDKYEATQDALTVQNIVHAFVAPALTLAKEPGCGHQTPIAIRQFLTRAFVSPGENTFLSKYFEPVRSRFIGALRVCLPKLELPELLWRYNMMVGALVYAMGGNDRMTRPPEAIREFAASSQIDESTEIRYMVNFISAGLTAA